MNGPGHVLIDRVNWIVDSDLSHAQKLALVVLARHDGPNGIFPSRLTIARKSGLSMASVKRTLAELTTMGLIQRQERYEEGTRENTSNLYLLTLPRSQVGSAGPQVGSHSTHVGSDGAPRWVQGEPQVGSHRAPEQPSLTAFIEQPISEMPSAPSGKRVSSKSNAKKESTAPEGYAEVVDAYCQHFEAARNQKPTFGSRQGAAIKTLIKTKGSAEAAIATLTKVYAVGSFWRDKATILQIAGDPDKYAAAPTAGGSRNGAPLKQAGPTADEYDWRRKETSQ